MLDEKDRKLIRILDKNSRTSNSEIAGTLGISKPLVAYRIERLLKEGLIERFYTIVNGVKLGYLYFRIYLKFQRISPNTEQKLMSKFIDSSFTTWVVKCRGSWDLVVSIYARDTEQFARTYLVITEEFQENIMTKKIVLVQNVSFSTRDYLGDSEGSVDSVYGGITENIPTDHTDHVILKELSKNSRIKLVDLVKKAGATVETIKSHIKKMEHNGIIRGHKVAFSYPKLMVSLYIISINLSNASENARHKLQNYCKSHPNSVYLVNIIGDHDVDLEVEVETQEQLDTFLRDLTNKFSEVIRNTESLQVVRQYKIDFYPFE